MSFIKLTSDNALETHRHEIVCRARSVTMFYRELGSTLTSARVGEDLIYVRETPDEIAAKISECEHGRSKRTSLGASQSNIKQSDSPDMMPVDEMAEIGKRLLSYRQSMGLTGRTIADESGISKHAIYDIESAASGKVRRRMSRKVCRDVAAYVEHVTEAFLRDAEAGKPKRAGYYCCLLHGTQYVRRNWNGAQWCEIGQEDSASNRIIAWQYLGRHAR